MNATLANLWRRLIGSVGVGATGAAARQKQLWNDSEGNLLMKRLLAIMVLGIVVELTNEASAQVGTPIFEQNFNGLTLAPASIYVPR
jgi:hypothetical protein